jgi:hypothetical protein
VTAMPEPIRDGDFWKGPLEAETYLSAVHLNPQRAGEGNFAYIVRISELVSGEAQNDAKMRAAGDDWRAEQ